MNAKKGSIGRRIFSCINFHALHFFDKTLEKFSNLFRPRLVIPCRRDEPQEYTPMIQRIPDGIHQAELYA
jgi:hypothetical protein